MYAERIATADHKGGFISTLIIRFEIAPIPALVPLQQIESCHLSSAQRVKGQLGSRRGDPAGTSCRDEDLERVTELDDLRDFVGLQLPQQGCALHLIADASDWSDRRLRGFFGLSWCGVAV